MTRFQKEISGQLGEFWLNHAKKEVEKIINEAKTEAIVAENGVIRWISNGQCLPDDLCEMLEYAGYNFDRKKTDEIRKQEDAIFFENYRQSMKNRKISQEELFEMQAAFGSGTTVVDIISGEKIQL